jgi:uncharacterized membrane protein
MQHAPNADEIHAIPERARRKRLLNMSANERWASALLGSVLLAAALKARGFARLIAGATGGLFVLRAARGHCPIYAALDISTRPSYGFAPRLPPTKERADEMTRVERALTIARTPEEVYQFLHDPKNIPHFAAHVVSIEDLGSGRFRAIAREEWAKPWEMIIENDEKNRAIVLRHSVDPKERLTILLAEAPGGRGTELKVALDFKRERKALMRALTVVAGDDPDTLLQEDLRRLKMLLEAGEVVTVEGQPMGHGSKGIVYEA